MSHHSSSPDRPIAFSTATIKTRLNTALLHPKGVLTALMGLALVLRLYKLLYHDYYDDEIISTFAARPPLSEMMQSLSVYSVHPPLYYMLLHFWMALGDDLFTIRLLSVLISAGCVALTYVLGRDLAGTAVGLVAAGIMAISPFQILHGQQARMYPLLTFLVLLATITFLRAWRQDKWYHWVGLSVAVASGLYTHVYFPFSLLGLNLWALFDAYQRRQFARGQWAKLIVAQVVAVIAFVPFLPQLFGTASSVTQWYWITNKPLNWLFALLSIGNNAPMALKPDTPQWQLVFMYAAGMLSIALPLLYSLRERRRDAAACSNWMLLHFLVWIPVIVATTISFTIKPILINRSLIGISAPLYIGMAWIFIHYRRTFVAQFVALAFVASSMMSLASIYPGTAQPNDLIHLSNYIVAHQQRDDAVAFIDWQTFETTALFHPRLPNTFVVPGPSASRTQWSSKADWQARMRYISWHTPQNVQSVQEFAPHYRRVWLVLSLYTPNLDYHQQTDQGWLEQHGHLIEKYDFHRAVVRLYAVDDAGK